MCSSSLNARINLDLRRLKAKGKGFRLPISRRGSGVRVPLYLGHTLISQPVHFSLTFQLQKNEVVIPLYGRVLGHS